jgi:asparagine synthetase B (glutamine-hydrolysing)
MPGLFGFFALAPGSRLEPHVASGLLAEMAQRMSHLGDEIVETWDDPASGLAIARIRVRAGRNVAWPGAGEVAGARRRVFVEGVIPGDTVSRVHEVTERGNAALASLEGSFSLAAWEPWRRRLTLAVDQRASRPLVYARVGGALYFAPEVKALLAVPGIDKALDPAAIGVFLGAGHLLSTQTLFGSVRRLSGGQRLIAEPGRSGSGSLRIEGEDRYRLSASGDGTAPRELEEELCALVRGAVERRAAIPATVVFLSGGVDSRILAAEAQGAARARGDRIRTVSWGTPERRVGSDVEVAAIVARAIGSVHRRLDREIGAYRACFVETTYLLDGLTDLPAYHPHEHTLMRALGAGGARVVLRGDECFGYESHVGTIDDALATLGLRRLAQVRRVRGLLAPRALATWGGAGAAALDELVAGVRGAHPDDAKDLLYFRHRLQGYLGSAAYLKQAVLDHETPLLDEKILAFNARIPAPLRAGKRLFLSAARRLSPEVFALPFATRDNLEDWAALVAGSSPVHDHVAQELADRESGIWEHVDREALGAAFARAHAPSALTAALGLRGLPRRAVRSLVRAVPPVERSLVASVQRRTLRFDQICFRLLVLKTFHDLFVTGDGSRRALARRLSPRGA